MAMRLFSSSPPPPVLPNPSPRPPATASFSLRLRRARAAAAAASAAAGGPERDGGGYEGEAIGVGAFDRGMAEIARKVPLFEPARGDPVAAATGERPLPVNLELWLYRAKVHTRKYFTLKLPHDTHR